MKEIIGNMRNCPGKQVLTGFQEKEGLVYVGDELLDCFEFISLKTSSCVTFGKTDRELDRIPGGEEMQLVVLLWMQLSCILLYKFV